MKSNFGIFPVGAMIMLGGLALTPQEARSASWIGGGLSPASAPSSVCGHQFAEAVGAATDGRVALQFFDSSQLGTGEEQIEGLATGTQQVYVGAGSQAASLVKAYSVLDIPFLFRDRAHFDSFLESDMVEELNQRMIAEFGVRVLAMNLYRLPRSYLTRDRHILKPEDLAGLRMRAPNVPIYLLNWEMLDAVPVKINYGEQYLALRQGVVDGTESAGEQIYPTKLHEVAPYITEAEFAYPQYSIYVSEAAYSALDSSDQKAISETAKRVGRECSELVRQEFAPLRDKIEAEGGEFAQLPPEAKQAFTDAVRKHLPKLEAEGFLPVGWFDRIQALR